MPDYVAPEKREPLQGLLRKPDPPWQSCGAVSGDPQFLHSILFFSGKPWFLFAPMARCAAFGVIGTAQSANEKQKRDMQLDHLRAPIFVFIRKTASPSPSSLRDATSPKVRGFGITEKHFGFARGSPFGRAAEQSEAERARTPTSKSWFICNYPMISAS